MVIVGGFGRVSMYLHATRGVNSFRDSLEVLVRSILMNILIQFKVVIVLVESGIAYGYLLEIIKELNRF